MKPLSQMFSSMRGRRSAVDRTIASQSLARDWNRQPSRSLGSSY